MKNGWFRMGSETGGQEERIQMDEGGRVEEGPESTGTRQNPHPYNPLQAPPLPQPSFSLFNSTFTQKIVPSAINPAQTNGTVHPTPNAARWLTPGANTIPIIITPITTPLTDQNRLSFHNILRKCGLAS